MTEYYLDVDTWQEIEEFLKQREDVNYEGTGPNAAMSMLTRLEKMDHAHLSKYDMGEIEEFLEDSNGEGQELMEKVKVYRREWE